MKINIRFFSKNYNSLKVFMSFFAKFCKNRHLNGIVSQTAFQPSKKIKKFSILKSPHVNKTAQEQFEYQLFIRQINISTTQLFKVLLLLKRIQATLFFDVSFQIKFLINERQKGNFILLNTDCYSLNFLSSISDLKALINYLSLFDISGEMLFKKN